MKLIEKGRIWLKAHKIVAEVMPQIKKGICKHPGLAATMAHFVIEELKAYESEIEKNGMEKVERIFQDYLKGTTVFRGEDGTQLVIRSSINLTNGIAFDSLRNDIEGYGLDKLCMQITGKGYLICQGRNVEFIVKHEDERNQYGQV